jgi:hypothetical protein
VICVQENEDLFMYLYDGGKFIKALELESLLRENVEIDWKKAIRAAYPREDSVLDYVYYRTTK